MRAEDLFCGCGGLSLGFQEAGFDVVLGVDSSPSPHCIALVNSTAIYEHKITLYRMRQYSQSIEVKTISAKYRAILGPAPYHLR